MTCKCLLVPSTHSDLHCSVLIVGPERRKVRRRRRREEGAKEGGKYVGEGEVNRRKGMVEMKEGKRNKYREE